MAMIASPPPQPGSAPAATSAPAAAAASATAGAAASAALGPRFHKRQSPSPTATFRTMTPWHPLFRRRAPRHRSRAWRRRSRASLGAAAPAEGIVGRGGTGRGRGGAGRGRRRARRHRPRASSGRRRRSRASLGTAAPLRGAPRTTSARSYTTGDPGTVGLACRPKGWVLGFFDQGATVIANSSGSLKFLRFPGDADPMSIGLN